MSPAIDLSALQPSDDERDARRQALVAEIGADTAAARHAPPGAATVRGRASGAGRVSRRAFVRGSLAATGVAAVGLTTTGVLPGLRGSAVDVVASARAAAAPTGGILHTVVRYDHGPGFSMAHVGRGDLSSGRDFEVMGQLTGDTETWTTESPARERRIMFVDLKNSDRTGRSETSQGPHEWRMHESWNDFVDVRPVSAQEHAAAVRARRRAARNLEAFEVSGDPVAAIRGLLDSGRLRTAGSSDVDGRPVARLVGRAPAYIDSGGSRSEAVDYEYLVDAGTFVPVRVTAVRVLPARPGDPEPAARRERRLVQRWTFERFERLPLTPENERLLTVDATGLRVRRSDPPRE
jgi:hypothetical protein